MKKLRKVLLVTFAAGLIGMNLSANSRNNLLESFSLSNLSALRAFAGEAWCDTTTQNDCSITKGDVTITGKGQPRATF